VAWTPTATAREQGLPGTLGIDVHGNAQRQCALLEGVQWRPQGLGRGRSGDRCRLQGGVSGEGARGEASHGCGHRGVTPDSGRMEGFICKMVLIELLCSGIPLVKGIIRWAVSARFRNLVLEDGVKTALELQDNHKIVRVPQEVNE